MGLVNANDKGKLAEPTFTGESQETAADPVGDHLADIAVEGKVA